MSEAEANDPLIQFRGLSANQPRVVTVDLDVVKVDALDFAELKKTLPQRPGLLHWYRFVPNAMHEQQRR